MATEWKCISHLCPVRAALQELDAAGLAWVGGEAWQPPSSLVSSGPGAMCDLTLDASIGAVLVGWDPAFSYAKLVGGWPGEAGWYR